MKRFFGCVLVAAAITLAFSVNAVATGASLKIGYLDPNVVIGQSQWGKKISEDMKKEEGRMSAPVEQKNQAFVSAREEFEKKKDAMDEKTRIRKREELQDMAADLQKSATEIRNKLNEQSDAALVPIAKKMEEIVKKIAKDEKYDFIITRRALLFVNDKDDLTQRVISELDKSSPK